MMMKTVTSTMSQILLKSFKMVRKVLFRVWDLGTT